MSVLRKATHCKLLLVGNGEDHREGNELPRITQHNMVGLVLLNPSSVLFCIPCCLSWRVFEPSLYLCREAFERAQCETSNLRL